MSLAQQMSLQLSRRIKAYSYDNDVYAYGTVIQSGDSIVHIEGLKNRKYGELLECSGGSVVMAMELSESVIGAVLLSGTVEIGEQVRGTGSVMEVPTGEPLLGRVIDPLGRPLDGKPLAAEQKRPVESPAPSIKDRQNVNRPLETGLLSIDSMIPIGRGQRELIIGDRRTGKTTIAVDTILNQKDKGVICVYCAIGQKISTVSEIVQTLTRYGAMSYSIVVSATASDSAALQYIAPYSACAAAEGFMYAGRDVLIVYDDLSKHAVAYRTMALLLHRPPGREAYPGDVFYLHSRLLERAAHLSAELGGGSITALPIIETMAGDISAYIPTNVISITDGQIFLEDELFNAGMRPAVNVGLSVSRVGRSAQHKAMRAVSGTLRMDLAQYREMAVFSQFGADLDVSTKSLIERGVRQNEMLKQPQHSPYTLSEMVVLLLASKANAFSGVPVERIKEFTAGLLEYAKKESENEIHVIDMSGELSASVETSLSQTISAYADGFREMLAAEKAEKKSDGQDENGAGEV